VSADIEEKHPPPTMRSKVPDFVSLLTIGDLSLGGNLIGMWMANYAPIMIHVQSSLKSKREEGAIPKPLSRTFGRPKPVSDVSRHQRT
jgi:hypothetical protein